MTNVRLTTAGESHGPSEVCVLEGIPAGLALTVANIDLQLARRQCGYGRGKRMSIESDHCEILAGVRLGKTIGSPIAIAVSNKDHQNWQDRMGVSPSAVGAETIAESSVPRPGHADYAGMLKYGYSDIRSVLERASARETVARVAGGAVCRRLLEELGVTVRARVVSVGGVSAESNRADYARPESVDWEAVEASVVGVEAESDSKAICSAVDAAREAGESLGGVFEVWAWGLCPGIGQNSVFAERLDARLFAAIASIPAIKGVELGMAFHNAGLPGSQVHDAFVLDDSSGKKVVRRPTNRAGGVEGGLTNGMPLVVRAAMKPIPTMTTPLASIDLGNMESVSAHVERSDVMAVPAARVVGEAMVCAVLADAYMQKFGGDSLSEVTDRVGAYAAGLEERGSWCRS